MVFESGEQSVRIGADTQYGIITYSGLEATDYDISASQRIDGCGEKITKKARLSRSVEIEFEYKPRRGKEAIRNFLIAFFSPYQGGTLTVIRAGEVRSIAYEVNSFQLKDTNMHERVRASVTLLCADPDFLGAPVDEPIMTWEGGWKWPFTLPFRLKQKGSKRKNIYNRGSLPTPVEIVFEGPAENPTITNRTVGETIRVKQSLAAHDKLMIRTEFGNLEVEIERNGVRENAFDYLDYSSRFWYLQPGDNMIEYTTENELDPQCVTIQYRERYLGI
jgi:hypothetical protein